MSNVFNILDARTDNILRGFTVGLDRVWQSTIAKYSANCDDARADDVLGALFDILRLRRETQDDLMSRALKRETSEEEFTAIQKQLDASPLPVVEAFYEKVVSVADLEDPLVLAAFEAAGEYLVRFLQLENASLCETLDAIATHLQLACDGRSQQALQRSQSQQEPLQEAEGTR